MVSKAVAALKKHGDTLAVAPTGAGKTVLLSALAGRVGGKQLILQHRDELTFQNAKKYREVNPRARVGMFNADIKDWKGDATFAMVQTLCGTGLCPPFPNWICSSSTRRITPWPRATARSWTPCGIKPGLPDFWGHGHARAGRRERFAPYLQQLLRSAFPAQSHRNGFPRTAPDVRLYA